MASDELEGRLAALELAFVIALEGLRPNPGYARIAVDKETARGRLPHTAAGEAVWTLGRIFRGAGGRSLAFGLRDLLSCYLAGVCRRIHRRK